ncbi:hypothetical protein ACOMHN_027498 [Nucella lapillus]
MPSPHLPQVPFNTGSEDEMLFIVSESAFKLCKKCSSKLSPISVSLSEIEEEFQEGELTEKGYWKKKCRLLEPVLSDSTKSQLKEAETDLRESILTEKGYFKRLAKVLENALQPPSDNSGFEPKSTPKFAGNKAASQSDSDGAGAGEGSPGRMEEDVENGVEKEGRGSGKPALEEEKRLVVSDAAEEEPAKEVRKKVKVKRRSKGKNSQSSEDTPEEESKDENESPRRKGCLAAAVSSGKQQPTITSMFGTSNAKKRRSDTREEEPMIVEEEGGSEATKKTAMGDNKGEGEAETEEQLNKRQKIEGEEHVSVEVKAPPPKVQSRCSECKQVLEDPDLKFFPGDSNEAVSIPVKP